MAHRLVSAFCCCGETPAQHRRSWDLLSAGVDLSLSRRGIWRRTCTSSWVHVEYSVLAVIKYLEALPPPHWSFLSLPLSGQRSDFPGASVKLQRRFHGLLPPQANPSSLPHFLVIKDVLHVRGERARGEHRGQRKMSFFAFPRPLSS